MTLPLTYPDIRFADDMDLFGTDTTSDLENLQQDFLHMLLEDPMSNLDALERGASIMSYLNGPASDLYKARHAIETAAQNDPRVDACRCVFSKTKEGLYTISITVQVAGTVLGLDYRLNADGSISTL